MMRNTMYFNGGDSASLGVVIVKLPNIPKAAERGEWEQLAGMDGGQFTEDGTLETVDIPVNLWIRPSANINAVLGWLSGEGALRFNDWGWYWRASCDAAFALVPCINNDGWTTTVNFKAQPHRYMYPEAAQMTVANGSIVTNPCTADALPRIEVTGSGDVNLMVGNRTLLINALSGSITLDCEAKQAFSDDFLEPNAMIEPVTDWIRLTPGGNPVSWTGNAQVKITPRWRWR